MKSEAKQNHIFQHKSEASKKRIPRENQLVEKSCQRFECVICKRIFTDYNHWNIHKLIHFAENECEICKKRFAYNYELTRHRRTHRCSISDSGMMNTNGEECKLFKCSVCKKEFTKSTHLVQHKRVHKGEKRFECEICRKGFTKLVGLDRHSFEMHSKDSSETFECDVCGKGFDELDGLEMHKRTMGGDLVVRNDKTGGLEHVNKVLKTFKSAKVVLKMI